MKNYYITEDKDKVEIVDSRHIDLSHRNIIEVVITDLPMCNKLRLDYNKINSVNIDMPDCMYLFLDYNKIESISLSLSRCDTLRLDCNNLKSVELNLPECETLYLSANILESVKLNLPKCETLDLSYNKLKSVNLSLPSCVRLDLGHNRLNTAKIDASKCDILFLCNNKLESINLDLPKISYLQSDLIKLVQSNGDIIMGFDDTPTIVDSEKKMGEFTIYRGRYVNNNKDVYVASRGKYFAHGDTMKKAVEDCNFKFLQATIDIGPYFAECKEKGIMSVSDYRLLTGACESGCNNFLESKDITTTEMNFDDAMKLLEENKPYGWDEIKELI